MQIFVHYLFFLSKPINKISVKVNSRKWVGWDGEGVVSVFSGHGGVR